MPFLAQALEVGRLSFEMLLQPDRVSLL